MVLSKRARARAVQLPAWNEALGLPRPWDQQWSLRLQQILALRDRPARVRRPVRRLARGRGQGRGACRRSARGTRQDRGNGRRARRSRERLHEAAARGIERRRARRDRRRRRSPSSGSTASPRRRSSPLAAGAHDFFAIDPCAEAEQIARAAGAPRDARGRHGGRACSRRYGERRATAANIMIPSIACARAGATTGEWAETLRRCSASIGRRRAWAAPGRRSTRSGSSAVRARVDRAGQQGCAGGRRCWSASPGWMAIPTAPSRSRCAPATAASRWSTTASA